MRRVFINGKFVMRVSGIVFGLLLLMAAACGRETVRQAMLTTEVLVTSTSAAPTPILDLNVTITPEVTPAGPLKLTIWLPEPFAPPSNKDAAVLLTDLIEAFQATQNNVIIETRLKKAQDVGGVISTLRAARVVAPSALPDLTLLEREDLQSAVQAGVVQPLDARVSAAIRGDFYTMVLRLGQVNGRLYGLPYSLEIEHLAYRAGAGHFASFEDVLKHRKPLVFPAGGPDLSSVFLLQYLSAGGSLNSKLNKADADALRVTLQFYEAAVAKGVVQNVILNYVSPTDYLPDLTSGKLDTAVLTSSMYLDLLAKGQRLEAGRIPLASPAGTPATIANGWMWVLTTADPDRQALAVKFLEWMYNPGRQERYNRVISMLPSQRAAMRQLPNTTYTAFVESLLGEAILPSPEGTGSTTARALQSALTTVIAGKRTAEQAVQDVMGLLST
jgi:ABC-type glycerol-3-phosphate transport system substrate-binding protein